MKKKFLALTLALALALSLAACGGKDAPAQDGAPDAPEVSAPEGGDAAPSEPGEAGSPEAPAGTEADVDLTAFCNTLREENTWPELMDLTTDANMKELLDSYYPGLAEISTKQCGVYIAAISAAVGEIALVEVKNAGAWYPETIEGWKTQSQIVSHGNYVMLAVGDNAASAVESFEALFA